MSIDTRAWINYFPEPWLLTMMRARSSARSDRRDDGPCSRLLFPGSVLIAVIFASGFFILPGTAQETSINATVIANGSVSEAADNETVFFNLTTILADKPAIRVNATEIKERANRFMNTGIGCAYINNETCVKEAFGAAHDLLPNDTTILYNHGVALAMMGNYTAAIGRIDAALAVDPGDAKLWYTRGSILKMAGNIVESGQNFQWAQQLDPEIGVSPLDLYPLNLMVNFILKNLVALVLVAGFCLLGTYIFWNERRFS